ncbi:sigma-54-dependent transcriptional regulator [Azospirillum brasilense]|uniref:Sigma-54-dependent Fis family transcriptional regulator n=1 Tax=Azospirillum brasilense TaxID=192 RepID=A0A235HKG7_AZOBR|nr:sigma-54 dependent transcriptional regulator [Azospirillum brasilense]OYD86242.1 sigma-54-dependent Fis family transcriptional regulator [Azospirillum brasilense]
MPARSTPVLLVEDTPSLARVYAEFLKKDCTSVTTVETGAAALEQLADGVPRIVLLDLQLPDMHGMDVLKRISAQALPCAVIIITAHGSVGVAVEAMRYGAYDFLVKPFSAERLTVTVRNAMERLRLAQLVDSFEKDLGRSRYHGFLGSSLAMQAVYRIIDSAASSRATVFITGESGTGKEVCAEAIHRQSPRADRPFIAINCGAIPKDLMESEIFGHMKGSFTGAVADREGAAARANGGTLFLDEICELAPDLQTKLLRFIQTGTFTPVGGSRLEKVDLRIICATNRDPLREVEEGRFREDLYYRLHVIPIHLPPLREREDDVLEICRQFLTDYAREEGKGFVRFSPAAEQALRTYHWPGNVRQVQNVVRNIVVLHDGDTVTPAMLPAPLGAPAGTAAPLPANGGGNGHGGGHAQAHAQGSAAQAPSPKTVKPLWEVERDAIEEAIAACDGNIPRAAALLEISASTIYRKRLAWQAEGKL